jgi:hypothetical protein
LTVRDGAEVANLMLIGAYTASDFRLAKDFHGGTYVYDPPAAPSAPAPIRLVDALAGFGGRNQSFAAVHAGGTARLSTSPLVTAAMSGLEFGHRRI